MPGKRKECVIRIENVSSLVVTIKLSLKSTLNSEVVPSFELSTSSLTLQSREVSNVVVFFEPSALGKFNDVVEINAPGTFHLPIIPLFIYNTGGDIMKVKVCGTSGIPIAIFPESDQSSQTGTAEISRARNAFMKKLSRNEERGVKEARPAFCSLETSILQNIMAATNNQKSRKLSHTLDFGICNPSEGKSTRCLTLMNLSEESMTVALSPKSSAVTCQYLVRIAQRSAFTVAVDLDLSVVSGIFYDMIDIVCAEFQNISVHISSFIGQPLYLRINRLSNP